MCPEGHRIASNFASHRNPLHMWSMVKETTIFMDEKESTDLYPPTLKGGLLFLSICLFSFCILFQLRSVKSTRSEQEIAVPDFAIVRGAIKHAFHGPYAVFLGIPFAQPPIGDSRFKYPQSLEKESNWQNVTFNANQYSLACHYFWMKEDRKEKVGRKYPIETESSEDCLYLNVFVPLDKNGSNLQDQRLPVMLWIHGGAFVGGSAHVYDASEFVTSQNVIIVTIQYRLSILGFAQTTDFDEVPGNMGLMDQTEAMKWVKKNIHHFGGDTNSITLFGESAGAISVGYHLISNRSAGLFNRAILESGAPLTMMQFGTDSGPLWMEKVAIELRCPIKSRKVSNTKFAKFTDETYKCLRSIPIEKLLQVETKLVMGKKCAGFYPSVDDERGFFGSHPFDTIKDTSDPFPCNISEILIGHNGDEGALGLNFAFPDLFPENNDLPKNLTYDLIKEKLIGKFPSYKDKIEASFKAMLAQPDKSKDNSTSVTENLSKMVGDAAFYCPNLHLVDAFLRSDKRKVYYYVFNARPRKSAGEEFKWASKALHAEEIQFVFGRPFGKQYWDEYSDDERRLSLLVMADWSHFASFGTPKNDQWKACVEEEERGHLVYGSKSVTWKSGLPESECSTFFEPIYQDLISRYKYLGNM